MLDIVCDFGCIPAVTGHIALDYYFDIVTFLDGIFDIHICGTDLDCDVGAVRTDLHGVSADGGNSTADGLLLVGLFLSLSASFFLGLTVDMFRNTPGVTAAALTIVGMVQPYLIELFLPRDAEPDIKSSARSLGVWHFLILAAILVVIFSLVFFALEAFTFGAWLWCLECAGASALLTIALIMAFETVRK